MKKADEFVLAVGRDADPIAVGTLIINELEDWQQSAKKGDCFSCQGVGEYPDGKVCVRCKGKGNLFERIVELERRDLASEQKRKGYLKFLEKHNLKTEFLSGAAWEKEND